MKTHPNAQLPNGTEPAKSLTKVLGQSEQIKDLVEECAQELSSVNVDLKEELAERDPLPGVKNALEKSEVVENKVQDVSEKLAVVNQALEGEVRDRHMLEHRFAAVVEQEEAARDAALHDVLTGLPNHALFDKSSRRFKRHVTSAYATSTSAQVSTQVLESRFTRKTAARRIRWSKVRIRRCTGLNRLNQGIPLHCNSASSPG